ncbi:MAG TPA: hypothetical protein ENI19_01340 [Candidatus Nealsonbacteria bacterium]|uniref:Uncharacterized protein n=1 Tax=marine sediment metagenome TaxID=412755 RepID=A0A0F9VSM6_9ZZZZ|nr:hypothetical protein [Candidatus Nealsonbacteria bacterium]HEB46336.1 hypothetical protein [Candidatus Nealsonbacteria bacterium]
MVETSKEQLLEEFSRFLIKLGKEIENRLGEKGKLEEELKQKKATVRKLDSEVFLARKRLAKLLIELSDLESKRREFEEKKFLLEKKKS